LISIFFQIKPEHIQVPLTTQQQIHKISFQYLTSVEIEISLHPDEKNMFAKYN